jgi:GTP-binding protein
MLIRKAEFVKSSAFLKDCPKTDSPEYAFIGRSNVGKSSLINMLCRRHSLAKTSTIPGKTRLINHFIINDSWYLVDLPGYGYARVSKKMLKEFDKTLFNYLCKRDNLYCVFVLIDSRIAPQTKDLEFINRLGDLQIPFAIVFTKMDKATQRALSEHTKAFKTEMLKAWDELPACFYTSAETGDGREELLDFVDKTNKESAKR